MPLLNPPDRPCPRPTDADRLFALSVDLLCVVSLDGYLKRVNPAFGRTLGWTAEELLARPLLDFVHPDDRAATRDALAALAQLPDVGTERFENRCRCRNGSYRRLAWRASLPDEQSLVYGVARDVTESWQSRQALRESEALLRDAQEIASVGSWAWDPRRRTFAWSDELHRILGVWPAAGPPTMERFLGHVHPDDRHRIEALILRASRDGGAFEDDHRVVRPDGSVRVVHCRARVSVDADGAPVRVIGSSQDVTEHRAAERALRASEERYRLATRATNDVVYEWDVGADTLYWSEGLATMLGHEPAGPGAGIAWWAEQVHPDDRAAAVDGVRAALASGDELWCGEYRMRRADGSYALVLERGYIERGACGTATRMVGALFDQSERQQLEARLRQAQKMEAVGRLASGIAHDFNNILTVIQNYGAFVAAELPAGGPVRQDLDQVLVAAGRAAELTQQLLAFGSQQVLEPRVLDVNQTVEAVAGMLRRVVGEDVALETELAADVWPVYADAGQLEQVVMNLAVNARDAMPLGGTLRLRTENVVIDAPGAWPHAAAAREPAPGWYVSLVVEDTGVGIDPAVLPHIFEPFFTTKGPGRGTGLGLATVYGIVEQSGGTVGVCSTPGAGSRFAVLLPWADAEARVAPRAPAPAGSRAPRGTETVLLVEDEAAVRAVVRRMLERQGYTVCEAGGPDEAARLAEARPPHGGFDLLLTDVVMPGQSGRALAERLTARWPGLRVLYMSGYADDEILRRGLARPGTAYLPKPFTRERLAQAVRGALDAAPPAPPR